MSNFKVLDLVVLLSKSEMRQEASSDIFFTILDWRFCYGEFEYFPLQFQGTNFGQKLLVEWTKSRKKIGTRIVDFGQLKQRFGIY